MVQLANAPAESTSIAGGLMKFVRAVVTLIVAGLGALLLGFSACVQAAYPDHPIRWIIDVPAGTTSDFVARLVGQRVGESMGVPIIVESRPGATGAIAYAAAAAAPPDGYTIVMITTTLAQNAALKPDQRALLKSLTPIAPLVATGSALVVRADSPAQDFSQFVDQWRASKDGFSYASVGVASTPHLAGEFLSSTLGLRGLHVPYGGTAPAFNDLLAGRVDFMFANIPAVMPQLRAHRLRALAVSSPTRSAVLPDVATLAELGLPKVAFNGWFGVATGSKVPREIVLRLQQEFSKAVSSPDITSRLLEMGGEPLTSTSDSFAKFIAEDVANWARIMKTIGVKPE
jgi:tripartite-type tricarboxylate transporter receptor subunit TctC